MERLPLFTVLLTMLMMVSVACASAHLASISPEQEMEELIVPGMAEEELRPGALHPWADMVKFCLAFVVCYYGFRMLEDLYMILSTLYAHLTGKRWKPFRSRWKHD
jgi:hypothetical protein